MTRWLFSVLFLGWSLTVTTGLSALTDEPNENLVEEEDQTPQKNEPKEDPNPQRDQSTTGGDPENKDTNRSTVDPPVSENVRGDNLTKGDEPTSSEDELSKDERSSEREEQSDDKSTTETSPPKADDGRSGVAAKQSKDTRLVTNPGFLQRLVNFLQFAIGASAIFAAVWFSMPFIRAYWGKWKAESPKPTNAPIVVTQEAAGSVATPKKRTVAPEWPGFKGARPQSHYLAKNFTTDQLREFLADLEASDGDHSDGPYSSWSQDDIDSYVQDVRKELIGRSQ
jgi:hypothetical protein